MIYCCSALEAAPAKPISRKSMCVKGQANVLPPPPLTGVLGLEVGLALQRGRQVVETQRQLPLEGGILLAQRRESPEGTLTHQLLDGRVAARNGVGSARFWTLHRGRGALWRRRSARWEGRDGAGRVCRTKQTQLFFI